jgi:hypothetical protein
MYTRTRSPAALITMITAVLVAQPAEPCGPDFPMSALFDREWMLLSAPEESFAWEVNRLTSKPADAFQAVEDYWEEGEREGVEKSQLTAQELSTVAAMREQSSGNAAFAVGEGLPAAVRLYTAAAVSFHLKAYDDARRLFSAAFAAPVDSRAPRKVWAAYMLGRAARDYDSARKYFAQTRALVRQGAPDPLGLAAASLGEEARIELWEGRVAQATDLYLQQAALGSRRAVDSLREVAQSLVADDEALTEGLRDPRSRNLILAYVLTYPFKAFSEDEDEDPYYADRVWERLVAALDEHPDPRAADRLARSAYTEGRYDVAGRLADAYDTPMAAWVRAKLALRRGDQDLALRAYARLVEAISSAAPPRYGRDPLQPEAMARICAESGVLNLARGEYVRALSYLYRAEGLLALHDEDPGYWEDVAYLAERILTVQELKDFVDREVPALPREEIEAAVEAGRGLQAVELRALLGRRLMRQGATEQAVAYFDDEYVRSVAEEYVASLRTAHSRRHGVSARAEAFYTAATIARFDGMEILGYELAPDYAVWDGSFEFSSIESPSTGNYVGPDEVERFTASEPDPEIRYQYTLTAVDHASRAADLLPRSTQAFAAVLCQATGWTLNRDPRTAAELYRRYVREGVYQHWAKNFGQNCPEPDFDQAARRLWSDRIDSVLRLGRRNVIVLVVLVGTAALLIGRVTARRSAARSSRSPV